MEVSADGQELIVHLPLRFIVQDLPPHLAASPAGKVCRLTPREREIYLLVLSGKPNKEIADRLFLSERAVKFHVSSLLAKFQMSNRHELLATFQSYPV